MSENHADRTSGGGIGIIGVLQIIFIVLKLCGLVEWSWVAVLIPLWVDIAFVVVRFIIIFVAAIKKAEREV